MRTTLQHLQWTLLAVFAVTTSVALYSRDALKREARARTGEIERLQGRIMADARFLDGDHGEAMRLYESLAERTGDTSLLHQRRSYLEEFGEASGDDPRLRSARLEARLVRAEEMLERYQAMEKDLKRGREQLASEERQLREVFGKHLEHQLDELRDTQEALAAARSTRVIRFPSAKKGEDVIYLGEVDRDMANGQGTGVWRTGSVYEGQWVDNLRHGKGAFTWPDGERYEGDYASDRRTGQGVYHWKNGQRWEGQWKDDMRHGPGVLYEANGKVRVKGVWEKDKLVSSEKNSR